MQRPDLASTAQYIAWHAVQTPEAPAIAEADVVVPYRVLAEDIVHCVLALESMGIVADTFVCVEHPRRYAHLVLLLACEVIGAATISLTASEVAAGDDILRHCDTVLSGGTRTEAVAPRTIHIPPAWFTGKPGGPPGPTGAAVDLAVLDRPVVADRMARIVRTSGTTGAPKAIILTFAVHQSRIVQTFETFPPDFPAKPNMLCMYHLATSLIHRRVLSHLQLGGTVLFALARHAWALIEAGAVHSACFAVGDIERSIQDARPPPAGHPLCATLFGAAVPAALRRVVRERLRATLDNSYASNETNLIATMDDDNVGTLWPGIEARIVNEAGEALPYGEAGLIRVRSHCMFSGYFNDPEMTAAAFDDGWFRTTDVGVMPERGRLIVLGRADDMLNIGGVKVPRSAVEDEIRRIDGVSDAVVMRMGDATEAGTLLAAVETGDDMRADLERRVGAVVSKYVGVFSILPLPALPRGESGKVARAAIETAFRQRNGHAAR